MTEIKEKNVITIEVTMLMPIINGERTSPRNSTATIKINRKPKERFCCKFEMV